MKRPRGVTIIGCLLLAHGLAQGALVGVIVAAHFSALVQQESSWLNPVLASIALGNWAGITANAIVAVLSLAGGVALLLLRPWAWTVALLLQGYSLAINLWRIHLGDQPYLEMVLPIIIVFYLNTHEVRRVFETLRHPPAARTLGGLDSRGATNSPIGTNVTGDSASAEPTPDGTPADQRIA